jgi:hypothetical protein
MAARGGKRPGAGRPKGKPSQKTIARLKIAEHATAEGITPLDVMLQTMRALWDQDTAEAKLAACEIAKDAAPYIHPRLSAIEQNTTLKGDTLSALMAAIDGRTTGIADGADPAGESPLAPEQSLRHH